MEIILHAGVLYIMILLYLVLSTVCENYTVPWDIIYIYIYKYECMDECVYSTHKFNPLYAGVLYVSVYG